MRKGGSGRERKGGEAVRRRTRMHRGNKWETKEEYLEKKEHERKKGRQAVGDGTGKK